MSIPRVRILLVIPVLLFLMNDEGALRCLNQKTMSYLQPAWSTEAKLYSRRLWRGMVTGDRRTAVGCSSNAPGDATFCPSRLPAEGSGIKVAQRSVGFSVLIVLDLLTNIYIYTTISNIVDRIQVQMIDFEDLGGQKCNVKTGPYRVAMYGPGLSSWSDGVWELD